MRAAASEAAVAVRWAAVAFLGAGAEVPRRAAAAFQAGAPTRAAAAFQAVAPTRAAAAFQGALVGLQMRVQTRQGSSRRVRLRLRAQRALQPRGPAPLQVVVPGSEEGEGQYEGLAEAR